MSGVFVQRDAELVATAHEVEVVHLVDPGLLSPADREADAEAARSGAVPVTRIEMSRTNPFDVGRAARVLRPVLAGADVIHTHAFPTLFAFAGRRPPRPWVHTEHWSGIGDPGSLSPRGRAVMRLTAPLLRRPDVVTAVSNHLADQVRIHRGSRPVSVVPSVVPGAPVVPPPRDPDQVRLVGVGGLHEGKDPLLALRTAQELRRQGLPASLTWVGDGPLRSVLESAAGPDDRLVLLGHADAAGVAAALDAADIFILPTRGETLCLSAIEAITHGRPVVLGARGGQRDYVVDDNGVLVEERSAAAYAAAVVDLWSRREELTPERVVATIGDRFHGPRVLDGYESAYERAMSTRRRR
ncbi:glycosyltransferase family 4 protein [Cellulosimicrobium cellulans]|uniref:glycosyltransferase family 4 protein n=1 Tax=Cellulosimicrobium cellulans TaxID=1710 RepID=UPI002098192B|nr:glycosyltransferase family 4 protein [Cellulosimicrobium cellulans]